MTITKHGAADSVASHDLFGYPDLLAARDLIPVERGETVRQWVERCYLAGIIGGFELEMIRNRNRHVWNEPYRI